jgi:hypothetical protein
VKSIADALIDCPQCGAELVVPLHLGTVHPMLEPGVVYVSVDADPVEHECTEEAA